MKVIVLLALFSAAYAAPYVFDYIKIPLNADEVAQLQAQGGFPIINSIPADAQNFDCASKKQSGFYADTNYKCQIFHRCDVNGNHTVYTCVNSTVFNQLTLTCDYWYNVDCNRAKDFEDFANSRLYSDQPLFDSPPADYVAPSQKGQQASAAVPVASKPAAGGNKAPKATKAPPKGSVQVGGTASISIQSRANDENAGGAAAESNEAGSNTSQDTTPAASDATTQAADAGETTAEATTQSA